MDLYNITRKSTQCHILQFNGKRGHKLIPTLLLHQTKTLYKNMMCHDTACNKKILYAKWKPLTSVP